MPTWPKPEWDKAAGEVEEGREDEDEEAEVRSCEEEEEVVEEATLWRRLARAERACSRVAVALCRRATARLA